ASLGQECLDRLVLGMAVEERDDVTVLVTEVDVEGLDEVVGNALGREPPRAPSRPKSTAQHPAPLEDPRHDPHAAARARTRYGAEALPVRRDGIASHPLATATASSPTAILS